MRVLIILLTAALTALVGSSFALAHQPKHSKAKQSWHKSRADRDCTPINGRYGYYGNPWCDTGSSRPPDIEFRERQRLEKRRG
jgi:hypothetical protein